ncbi:MAG: glutamate racemase [Lachnospiraceae bacterium]|nr:glutamate racemase [Lachnospiraceae bacterium]
MDNRPIGVFDSGVGGLTCIPTLQKLLPNERVVYYGDTARTPYGSKTIDTIREFSYQIADYLISHDVKMIMIVCNTVSATCLDALRNRYPNIPIIGVVEPMANRIVRDAKNEENKPIGVIGTKVTVKSGIYSTLVRKKNPNIEMYSKACPVFVPLIEEGIVKNEIMDLTIHYYLDDFIKEHDLKKLVLGCTHYPYIKKNLKRLYPDLELLNPSAEIVNEVKEILTARDMLAGEDNVGEHQCYASDLSENFYHMINLVFEDDKDVKVSFKKFNE